MNDREISELKLDMLFSIFGISIVDHEEVIFCDHIISGRRIIPSMQKDIQIGILEEKEPWYIRGRYDSYDVLREAVRILEHVDNSESFTISSERWPILTQRRPFVRTLERRANIFLKECRYLPDFKEFRIYEVNTPYECYHRIQILMGNGKFLEHVMDKKDLGRGYYQRLVSILLNMFEKALEIQEEIDKERHNENEKLILSILGPIYYYAPLAGSWQFEVLPSVKLFDLSLESIKSHVQPKLYIPDIDYRALERNINREFKRCYNRFESCWIEINSFIGDYILNIRFQGLAFNMSIDRDMLYHYIIHILDEIICKANEMEAKSEFESSVKTEFARIQLNSIYGLGADLDGDALVVMQRGRGYGKSLAQINAINKLLKNGVSKIQIAPEKVKKLHDDILDSYRYLYAFNFMNPCTATAIVRYCESDVKATMEAALAMKENNKQVVLEQLEEKDPQVPKKIFESLVTGSPNGELEILIDVNKEDKTMMIPVVRRPEIKEVIFNEPATIVYWKDGTKTVVKCGDGEKFDPEKGVAIALAKKMLYSKDYSRVIASSDDWKKAKEAKKKAEAKKAAAKKKALKKAETDKPKKAAAKKKPMPKLPVNANITKTSTVKKTTRKGAK